MGFIEIINIIMQILAFIAGLFQPKEGVRHVMFVTDFDCQPIHWTAPAVVNGGNFSGTAEVKCLFQGKGGEGLVGLRNFMIDQLKKDGQSGEGQVENYQGVPSIAYKSRLEMLDNATAHGTTHIATDGFTVLRNVFQSQSISARGNGKLLESAGAEMEVRPTQEVGVYELRTVQSLRARKPWMISSDEFKTQLKAESEESLMERAVGGIQEMASHL